VGIVVVPAAATAFLFLTPEVGASWLRLLGLVTAMILATMGLVAMAGRGRRALAARWVDGRLRRFNEAEAARSRELIAALDEVSSEVGAVAGTAAYLQERAEGLIRLSYLVEHRSPVSLRKEPKPAARRLLTTRLLGLALWARGGGELRLLASFVALPPEEEALDAEGHLERFAELPLQDLASLLEGPRGLPLEERSTRFRLP
jgi:hypothetical protein